MFCKKRGNTCDKNLKGNDAAEENLMWGISDCILFANIVFSPFKKFFNGKHSMRKTGFFKIKNSFRNNQDELYFGLWISKHPKATNLEIPYFVLKTGICYAALVANMATFPAGLRVFKRYQVVLFIRSEVN